MTERDAQRIAHLEMELAKWMRWAKHWEDRAKRSNAKLRAVRRALDYDKEGSRNDD